MQNEDGAMVGQNGIKITDAGDCWRAHSGVDVVDPQMLDYQSRDGRKSGIKYALGPDRLTGRMRIAWVDYPKSMYEVDSLLEDEEVVHILTHCNVCNAVEQVINRPQTQFRSSVPVAKQQAAPTRVSLGDAFSSGPSPQLPKYLTAGINIGKQLGLRPAGNALFTLGVSVLSDIASGMVRDPAYRSALQSFSDEMVDSLTPDLISAIKEDAVEIAEALEKDHTDLMSRKFIVKHMIKSPADLKRELLSDDSKQRDQSSRQNNSSSQRYQPNYSPVPIKLWE